MDNSELESFLTKFRCLWNTGFDAHLELDSHAGQAWVSLHVRIGHALNPLNHLTTFLLIKTGPEMVNQDNAVEQEGLLQEQNNMLIKKVKWKLKKLLSLILVL